MKEAYWIIRCPSSLFASPNTDGRGLFVNEGSGPSCKNTKRANMEQSPNLSNLSEFNTSQRCRGGWWRHWKIGRPRDGDSFPAHLKIGEEVARSLREDANFEVMDIPQGCNYFCWHWLSRCNNEFSNQDCSIATTKIASFQLALLSSRHNLFCAFYLSINALAWSLA